MKIDQDIRLIYPFNHHYFEINGHKIHYVDEGNQESEQTLIFVHGNPTWSFYFRNLLKHFRKTCRVIAIDHIGCGLSDKPQDYNYSLKNHIDNLEALTKHLKLPKYSLILHDWGGAIGMGLATRAPEKVDNVILLNTAAFRSQDIPKRISICRIPVFGEAIVRHFNAFAWPATFMAVQKKLPANVKKGYLLPYNNYKNRIATAKFVQDIPLEKHHQSYETLKNIEEKLHTVKAPKLLLWGQKDFCFHEGFFNRWLDFYPQAKTVMYPDAGHYVIEDKAKEVQQEIEDFITA